MGYRATDKKSNSEVVSSGVEKHIQGTADINSAGDIDLQYMLSMLKGDGISINDVESVEREAEKLILDGEDYDKMSNNNQATYDEQCLQFVDCVCHVGGDAECDHRWSDAIKCLNALSKFPRNLSPDGQNTIDKRISELKAKVAKQ